MLKQGEFDYKENEINYHSTVGSGLPETVVSNLMSSNSIHSTFSGFLRNLGISFLAASHQHKTFY